MAARAALAQRHLVPAGRSACRRGSRLDEARLPSCWLDEARLPSCWSGSVASVRLVELRVSKPPATTCLSPSRRRGCSPRGRRGCSPRGRRGCSPRGRRGWSRGAWRASRYASDCEDSAAGLCLIVMLRSLACSRRVAQAAPVNVRTQPGDALPSRRRLRAPCRVAPSSAECAATSAIEPADPVDCVVRRLRGSCVRGIRACRCSSSPAAPATPSSTCRPAPAVRPRLSGPARAPGLRPVCAVGAGRTRKAPL